MTTESTAEVVADVTGTVAEGTTPAPDATTEQPRLYGGKYATVEELEAAYAAAQAPAPDTTTETEGKPDGAQEEEAQEKTEGSDEGTVKGALEAAGLSQDKYTDEFHSGGTLSDESFAELEKAGFSRDLVDVYLDGLRGRQSAYEATVSEPVGGMEGYKALVAWAGENLDEASIKAFNDSVTSGDTARAKLAVAGLAAQMPQNKTPKLLNGRSAPSAAGGAFRSREEVHAAMRDPRYRNDPAYRADVAERLRTSPAY